MISDLESTRSASWVFGYQSLGSILNGFLSSHLKKMIWHIRLCRAPSVETSGCSTGSRRRRSWDIWNSLEGDGDADIVFAFAGLVGRELHPEYLLFVGDWHISIVDLEKGCQLVDDGLAGPPEVLVGVELLVGVAGDRELPGWQGDEGPHGVEGGAGELADALAVRLAMLPFDLAEDVGGPDGTAIGDGVFRTTEFGLDGTHDKRL